MASSNGAVAPTTFMTSRKAWETADTIVAATVTLLVVVFSIFGFLVWQAFGNAVTQASTRAERAADGLSDRARLVVGASLSLLDIVAHAESGPEALATDGMTEALARLPARVSLGVYDRVGRATWKEADLPTEVSGSSYFDTLLGGEDWVVDTLPGTPDLVVAKRLSTGEAFAGALVLRIDHSILSSFWSLMDLGAGSTVSLVREDGLVVARHPPLDAPLNLLGQPAFTALTSADSGSYLSESSPADGVARAVGFQHVPDLRLITVASVATDNARAAIWTSTGIVMALLGPIGLALLVGSVATAGVLRRSEAHRRELAAALAHNEVLLKEIHHRVKNNLQSVNSLLQLQPISREVRREMGRQIAAMSAVHEHIYRSGNFNRVAVKEYLQTLVRDIRAGQAAKVEITERLDDLWVHKDVATPLALIVSEVLSNAFKHAFPDGRDGKLSLTLNRDQDGLGHLTIQDNGVGFDPEQQSKGIGQRLIMALSQQMGGTATYTRDNGTSFDLTFPLAS